MSKKQGSHYNSNYSLLEFYNGWQQMWKEKVYKMVVMLGDSDTY